MRRPCISRNTAARRPCISRNTAARRPDLTTVQAGSGCVHFRRPYDSIYIRPLVAVYGRIRPARTRPRLRLGLVLASRIHPYTAPRGLIYNTYCVEVRYRTSTVLILDLEEQKRTKYRNNTYTSTRLKKQSIILNDSRTQHCSGGSQSDQPVSQQAVTQSAGTSASGEWLVPVPYHFMVHIPPFCASAKR